MTQSNQNYFNLTADGIGFLNRPREVQGKSSLLAFWKNFRNCCLKITVNARLSWSVSVPVIFNL
ncbi:DUF3577 domain-containing protein [Neisseria gonorrhoeae]